MRAPPGGPGLDVTGKKFEVLTATDDVSASGFSASCMVPLAKEAQDLGFGLIARKALGKGRTLAP